MLSYSLAQAQTKPDRTREYSSINNLSGGVDTITDAITATAATATAATAATAAAGFVSTTDDNHDRVTMTDLTRWFMNLFSFRLSSVIRRKGGLKWLEISRFHHLTDEEILEALQSKAKLQRGYCFDSNTKFLVLQIPESSPYHNRNSIGEMRKSFEEISVKPKHYQFDEDWYLHIYLSRAGSSAELSRQLRQWCISEGYEVGTDILRIHPSEFALPFPLQSGFTWLNERCQLLVRRDELSFEDALAFFCQDAKKNCIDPDDLLAAFKRIESARQATCKDSACKSIDRVTDSQNLSENSLNTDDCLPLAGGAENVVTMRMQRPVDDILFLYKSVREQPCEDLPADSSQVVFEDFAVSETEPEIETERATAIEESQLLLFPALKQSGTAKREE